MKPIKLKLMRRFLFILLLGSGTSCMVYREQGMAMEAPVQEQAKPCQVIVQFAESQDIQNRVLETVHLVDIPQSMVLTPMPNFLLPTEQLHLVFKALTETQVAKLRKDLLNCPGVLDVTILKH
jgi:hypothetical protein